MSCEYFLLPPNPLLINDYSGQVPSNLALRYIRPRYFFPSMMVAWAGLTMCSAAVHHPRDLMAIRFFQGIAESTTFVGTHYILGAWFTEREIGKRSGLFTSSGLAGTMFGGFLQTAIHSGLNGRGGLAGWRWLFIVSYTAPNDMDVSNQTNRLTASSHCPSPSMDSFSSQIHPAQQRPLTFPTKNAPSPSPASPTKPRNSPSISDSWSKC